MKEVHLTLSLDVIQALLSGDEVALELEELTLVLDCGDGAVKEFQRAVELAMLHLLPTPPGIQ